MYVDRITCQTFNYANDISCENNPQNIVALDPVTGQIYVLTTQPINKDPPVLFDPTQIQTAISPNTFTAQDAGRYFKKNSNTFGSEFLLKNTPTILYNF